MTDVSNLDDVIDSRDVIARISELEEELEDHPEPETGDDPYGSERDELAALKALVDECENCGDWKYGATLIRDSYFETYAEELAEDLGLIKDDASWPYNCIDWEQTVNQLQVDYIQVDFDGVTYWIRDH